MRDWFATLPPRDQLALMILGGVVIVFATYRWALLPASESRQQMALNNTAAVQTLARVDQKVSRLLALRQTEGSQQSRNLSSTLSAVAQNTGLTIKRLQPNSRGEVQVRFESVDFDALLQWLQTVEGSEGLRIIDASLSDGGRSGGVNATLRVRGD